MDRKLCQKITVYGRVQGVGFRPAVCNLGLQLALQGFVYNAGGFVEIIVAGTETSLNQLVRAIKEFSLPVLIEDLVRENLAEAVFNNLYADAKIKSNGEKKFFVAASIERDDVNFFPADLAICPRCKEELKKQGNRRNGYSYISCAKCGPRYTIIHRLPYDRKNTTMKNFGMCLACQKEYTGLGNFRQHAETISCHSCGPQLIAYRKGCTRKINSSEAVAIAKQLLLEKKIILVKAIGGFNLVCLATDNDVVTKLREIKHRPSKPFAVMCQSLEKVTELCYVSEVEKALLESEVRPIVLLKPQAKAKELLAKGVVTQCSSLGVMLPSMGFYVQLSELGIPLIVTSCNYSGAPIIYKDAEAFSFYETAEEVAGIFTYEREILRPADDAVVRSVRLVNKDKAVKEKAQVLRRTRGYLPEPIALQVTSHSKLNSILAVGAEMEPGFCLATEKQGYLAQLPGRLEEELSEKEYLLREQDWEQLLAFKPKLVIGDLHPSYSSTAIGKQIAAMKGIPFIQVQHHHAHALSVMAEHGLVDSCLAVCFDGTGYGDDNTVWGGDFLICKNGSYKRLAHLEATPMLGGDGSMKQAWKSAMCYVVEAQKQFTTQNDNTRIEAVEKLFLQEERYAIVKAALENNINVISNSSMGRLFDAASYILGLASENTHQGHCAQAVEAMAELALAKGLEPIEMHFEAFEDHGNIWSPRGLWEPLVRSRALGSNMIARAALGFHRAIVELVVKIAQAHEKETKKIILCGGCFANRILLEECYRELANYDFKVYFNKQVAIGDGGLALGQAYYGLLNNLS